MLRIIATLVGALCVLTAGIALTRIDEAQAQTEPALAIISLTCGPGLESVIIHNSSRSTVSLAGYRLQSDPITASNQDVDLIVHAASIGPGQSYQFLSGPGSAGRANPAAGFFSLVPGNGELYRDSPTADVDWAQLVGPGGTRQRVNCYDVPTLPTEPPSAATATTVPATATATVGATATVTTVPSTATSTAITPTSTPTAVPATPTPVPPTATMVVPRPPNTGSRPAEGSSPNSNLLLAGIGALVALAGGLSVVTRGSR